MRLDEMIIKANADGKTYFCKADATFYSAKDGFSQEDTVMYMNGWEEVQKRHLTVSEAEKELDCVIDTPLLNSLSVVPKKDNNVLVVPGEVYAGYYSYTDDCWRIFNKCKWENCSNGYWIDLPRSVSQVLNQG